MTTIPNITEKSVYDRLIAQLPPWFGNPQFVPKPPDQTKTPTTNFNNLLWIYITTALIDYYQDQYVWQQMRIGAYELANDPNVVNGNPPNPPLYPIATGDNLDLIANDYFGGNLVRRAGESDNNFRNRILSNVMRLKATRPTMFDALLNLVTPAFIAAGRPVLPPQIYESWYPFDNGGYNVATAIGYNVAGAYGTGNVPYTCTIIVFLPNGIGLGGHTPYSTTGSAVTWGSGYGNPDLTDLSPPSDIPQIWYGSESLLTYYITEQDVVTCIALTKVLGTVCNLIIYYV